MRMGRRGCLWCSTRGVRCCRGSRSASILTLRARTLSLLLFWTIAARRTPRCSSRAPCGCRWPTQGQGRQQRRGRARGGTAWSPSPLLSAASLWAPGYLLSSHPASPARARPPPPPPRGCSRRCSSASSVPRTSPPPTRCSCTRSRRGWCRPWWEGLLRRSCLYSTRRLLSSQLRQLTGTRGRRGTALGKGAPTPRIDLSRATWGRCASCSRAGPLRCRA
mmetsp:Transcript_57970/g.142205  ORF Transcript_57970/g.142205 Transcript_57970/m.142205 type:complete len:220 (-) Transcript_57970:235-894(-)